MHAYDAQDIHLKPIEDQVTPMDASLAYGQGYMWNQMDNVTGVMGYQESFLVHQDQVVEPSPLWQPQLGYSDASNAQPFENWDK